MLMLMPTSGEILEELRHILRWPLVDMQPWYPFSVDMTVDLLAALGHAQPYSAVE